MLGERKLIITEAEARHLSNLYLENTKHSGYQPPPGYLTPYLPDVTANIRWRDVRPRVDLLFEELAVLPPSLIVEIGANSGYQTLALARHFPHHKFIAIEGSLGHSKFITSCVEIENLTNVEVFCEYTTPALVSSMWPECVILDFNVAHHIGSDFRSSSGMDIDSWWDESIGDWLSPVNCSKNYWFSVGFRLAGHRGLELHDIYDPSGFLNRILRTSHIPENKVTGVWFFDSDTPNENTPLASRSSDLGSVGEQINEVAARGVFVGEYFRRPVIRFG